jgi:hypothetical protein
MTKNEKMQSLDLYGGVLLIMESASTSETSVNLYQATVRDVQEDSHFHTRLCENVKSHPVKSYQRCLNSVVKQPKIIWVIFTSFGL